MIRFRNPSSSLDTMLASFEELHSALKDKEYFDNNDIAGVLAKANLMASSGFTGDVAISRGANSDKSRDKTYNNAKMFAEIFRLLGLISIVNGMSSNYRFTLVGEHMAVHNADKKLIIEQCVLGVNNPNKIMDVSYDESVRFFSCVLLSMDQLDGYICRDEMILGPMSVNDTNPNEYEKMIKHIKGLRRKGNYEILQNELIHLARSLKGNKKDGMSVTSVQNCTRFPISVLKYCNWVNNESVNIYGKQIRFMTLTQHGKDVVEELKGLSDLRLKDYEKSTALQKQSLIRLGTYSMLGRAKFDLSPIEDEMDQDIQNCETILNGKDILFSPYQTLEYSVVNEALHLTYEHINGSGASVFKESSHVYKDMMDTFKPKNIKMDKNVKIDNKYFTKNVEEYAEHIRDLYQKTKSVEKTTEYVIKEHINDKKTEYYPLVETLFRIIGVDCHKSRDGVNGERWDAMIRDAERSIPIEIKSPTEEMHISVKAIRQALENKIILLSRKTYATTNDCSTYAVGYYPPNDRAEVFDLIANIKKTFGVNIAVFDISSLIRVTVNIIIFNKGIDIEKLYSLEGIVNVTDF